MNTRARAWILAHNETIVFPILIGVAVTVIMAGVAGFAYYRGYDRGGASARLEQLELDKKAIVKKTARDSVKVAIAKREATKAVERSRAVKYSDAREKVEIRGDTIATATATVVVPQIAQLIRVADTKIFADSIAIVKLELVPPAQDSVLADYRTRSSIDDSTIKILDHEKRPRCGVKCGIVLGVGGVFAVAKVLRVIAAR